MGYYPGRRENPCPRCGGTVWTVFISVGPMSYDQRCDGCATVTFTEDEERALGRNVNREPILSLSLPTTTHEKEPHP